MPVSELSLRDTLFRSPRPDFIETYVIAAFLSEQVGKLFRSPRPDFIETMESSTAADLRKVIVPVSKTGLY